MAHRQTRHELIGLAWGPQPKAATRSATVSREVVHPAEVGIGMVMATDSLPLLAHHWPGPLQMQRHPLALKPQGRHVVACRRRQLPQQSSEGGVVMELVRAVEIPRPGAAFFRIPGGLAPQPEDVLQEHSGVQGVRVQLQQAQGEGEEGLQPKAAPRRRRQGNHGTRARQRFRAIFSNAARSTPATTG
jgi:hypothetical protein